jgi:hypothetical protein
VQVVGGGAVGFGEGWSAYTLSDAKEMLPAASRAVTKNEWSPAAAMLKVWLVVVPGTVTNSMWPSHSWPIR